LESLELQATIRTTKGNNPARALRREGSVPAVMYGPGAPTVMLSLNRLQLDNLLKKIPASRTVLDLSIEGDAKSPRKAMIKEIQSHPVTKEILHADFYEVSSERKISVQVPVVAFGKSKGVEMGGMLQIIRRKLEVSCFPTQIPEAIRIDVTELGIGDVVHVKDITPPTGVEIPAEVNFTVITVIGAKVEKSEEGQGETEAAEAPQGKSKSE
jgi:large subunit ribosomal protein L25